MNSIKHKDHSSDIIVVGAGLCGLATALLLREQGRNVNIIEARASAGGRVRSVFDPDTGEFLADLGPSWVWPAFQPIIGKWLDKLDLQVFPQFESGEAIVDFGPDQAPKSGFLPNQQGNARVVHGSQALVGALLDRLPEDSIYFGTPAQTVSISENGIAISSEDLTFTANQAVIAVPPRVALKTIRWNQALPTGLHEALHASPTWMAPHAKFVVFYETAFWRKQNLSGRIVSRSGPIAECHDHCSPDESIAALWGFLGWPYTTRIDMAGELETQIRLQLRRCFGPHSPEPICIEEWSQDPYVATADDLNGEMNHPSIGPDILRQVHFNGLVTFAGSETAEKSPGLIEGAFNAAERVVHEIIQD
jgi:monoamine oxidase